MSYGLKAICLILFSSHSSYQSRRRGSQYFNKKLKHHLCTASALAKIATPTTDLENMLPFPAETEPLWQHCGQVMGWQIRYQELTFPFCGRWGYRKEVGALWGGRSAERSQREQKRREAHGTTRSLIDESAHGHRQRRECCLRKRLGNNNGGVSGNTDTNQV